MRRMSFSRMNKIAAIAILALLSLTGCGGGAPTSGNPVTSGPTAAATYVGPAAGNADVQAFKINLWDNIRTTDRCGKCHYAGGQTPSFARTDDVNLAYQDANTVVDLASPSESRMVAKVRGGHNCWLADPNACGDLLTKWISNWAGSTSSGSKTIQLIAPPAKDAGASKSFPADPSAFGATVWPILKANCSRCHTAESATSQQPYFASSDLATAYAAAMVKINLDGPDKSRFVVRLRDENHNCWNTDSTGVSCAKSAQVMLTAITNFANGITATPVDPTLVLSKALGMYDGVVASGGNRFDNNVIAEYEFKTGSGTTAYDTSGVDPALDLTLTGDVTWVGGWGLQVNAGKAQGLTSTSKKLHDLIGSTGEYSIEAWVAPANVTQAGTPIISYSGGTMVRDFTLAQTMYNYDFLGRSSKTDANGAPALSTPDAKKALQASLQHVVATFDPVNGRRIYVNGELVSNADSATGGSLADWDDTFAFVLGNEVSGNRQWKGLIKLVAIHNRALTQSQIQQNFDAGVGEKYFLLFNISSLIAVPQAYIMFEVSQYDSYSYLFNHPKFISLDATAKPGDIALKGMRIGVNGKEASIGQAYRTLDTHIVDANYTSTAGANLSNVGTIIAVEKGPMSDEFFLTFDVLGSNSNVHSEAAPLAPPPPADVARPADIGIRTFERINASMAAITGVSPNVASVKSTYTTVKQQMPTVPGIEAFLSSHQIGIAQLGIAYCSALVDDATLRGNFFPGFNMASATLASPAERALVIGPLVAKTLGSNTQLQSQPQASDVTAELNSLIDTLCPGGACNPSRTPNVVKAMCTAALASGATSIQ